MPRPGGEIAPRFLHDHSAERSGGGRLRRLRSRSRPPCRSRPGSPPSPCGTRHPLERPRPRPTGLQGPSLAGDLPSSIALYRLEWVGQAWREGPGTRDGTDGWDQSPPIAAGSGRSSFRLKIPVSGVQFSPCPPFLLSATRWNSALGAAFCPLGSRESLVMGCDPLGWLLTADWPPFDPPFPMAIGLLRGVSAASEGRVRSQCASRTDRGPPKCGCGGWICRMLHDAHDALD